MKNINSIPKKKVVNILNNISCFVLICDLNGIILTCNKSFEDNVTKAHSKLKNLNIKRFIAEKDNEKIDFIINETLKYDTYQNEIHFKTIYGTKPFSILNETVVYNKKKGILIQAKEILKSGDNEKKYKILMDSMLEGIWHIDKNAYTTYVNSSMAEMLGYLPHEMTGKHLFNFMDEKNINLCKDLFSSRKAGIKQAHEFEFIKKNGGTLYALLSSSAIINESNEFTGAIATVRDISAIKHSQERLKLLTFAVENSYDAVLLIDQSHRIIYANKSACAKSGYSKDEILKLHTVDLFDDPDIYNSLLKEIYKNGFIEAEIIGRKKSGEKLSVLISATLLKNENSEPMSTIGIFRDITKIRKLESKLRESEERHRSLIENIPDAVWTRNSEGDFIYASFNIEKITEYPLHEIENSDLRSWLKNIHPEQSEKIGNDFKKSVNYGIPFDVEYRYRTKKGKWIWIHERAVSFYEKNGIIYADGVISDITQRKTIEFELKKYRDELETLVDEKTHKHKQTL